MYHLPTNHIRPCFCLIFTLLSVAFPAAGEQDDPSSKAIEQAMTPTEETVAMNPPALRVRVTGDEIVVGKPCTFHAEIHNTGGRDLVIYMPGMTGRPVFESESTSPGPPDEFGPPLTYGRMGHRDGRRNFVVLRPGDYYGRSYIWDPPAPGKVVFSFRYQNTNLGRAYGLSAWVGKTPEAKSASVRVVGGPKAISVLSASLASDEVWTRCAAAQKLGYLKEPAAVPLLLRALDDTASVDNVNIVQRAAAYALQRLSGENLGLPADMLKFRAKEHVAAVRRWARTYLEEHPDAPAAPPE